MTREVTYGFGGAGLLVSPWADIKLLRDGDDGMTLYRGKHAIGRLERGEVKASAQPSALTAQLWQFGPGGPTLELADGVGLADVAGRFDVGLADAPWTLLGPGFFIALPVGLLVIGGNAPGEPFELHLPNANGHLVAFARRAVMASHMTLRPGPGQQVVDDVELEGEGDGGRVVRYLECAYVLDGAPWRQRVYAVPLAEDRTLVMTVQATVPRMDAIFDAADDMALDASLA